MTPVVLVGHADLCALAVWAEASFNLMYRPVVEVKVGHGSRLHYLFGIRSAGMMGPGGVMMPASCNCFCSSALIWFCAAACA